MRSIVLVLLAMLAPAPAPSRSYPQTLFAAERFAVGGAAWNGIVAVRRSGTIIAGGATGRFEAIVDRKNGYTRQNCDTGPFRDVSGFDGVTWDEQQGIISQADLPSLQADAVTQAYVARDGWWNASDPAGMTWLGVRTGQGTQYDVVAVVPAGGSRIDVWLDRVSHLIDRTIAHTDRGALATNYSHWKAVEGKRLSFNQRQTDATGATTIVDVKTAAFDASVPPSAFARPTPQPLGTFTQGSFATVQFRLNREPWGHIVLQSLFDGAPLAVYFDSGGANYVVPAAARKLGIAIGGGLNVEGVGTGSVAGGFTKLKTIAAGSAELRDQTALVAPLPFPALHPRAGFDVDGLLGFEFLSEFRTTIDYQTRRITFEPLSATPPSVGTTVPLLSDGHSVYVDAAIDGVNGLFRVDTGDGDAVSIFHRFADDHGLFRHGGLLYVSPGGVGGTVPYREFRAKSFVIAGATLRAPIVDLSKTNAGSFSSRSIAGNIGAGVLGRFTLIFNYGARTLTFVPNDLVNAPFPADRSGLSITQNFPDAIAVLGVVQRSPADAAGIRANDEIVSVDGRSVARLHLGLEDLYTYLYGGTRFSLTLRRGGRTIPATIQPRSLI